MMDYSDHMYSSEEVNGIISNKDHNIDTNLISDGYHTFGELYEHRIALFRALCSYINGTVDHESYHNAPWKSIIHSDGTTMDGWFIAGIGILPGEQISYHIPRSLYNEWPAEARLIAPTWDGHTSTDVLKRLSAI